MYTTLSKDVLKLIIKKIEFFYHQGVTDGHNGVIVDDDQLRDEIMTLLREHFVCDPKQDDLPF